MKDETQLSFDDACRYFGYDPDEVTKNEYHLFPTDDFMLKMKEMYEFARNDRLARKASRIVIDHDPRFPVAMIQVVTDKNIYLSPTQGKRIREAEAQGKEAPSYEALFGHTGLDQSIRETLGLPE